METLSTEAINRMDLVNFLTSFRIEPAHIDGHQYTYHSPLKGHPLVPPSFVVDRATNTWHETFSQEKGNFLDFATRFFQCTIGELQERLSVSRVSQPATAKSDEDPVLLDTIPIRSVLLQRWLWARRIPLDVAHRYCIEASYRRQYKRYCALAFRCDTGGYELFTPHRQYHIPPTGPTLLVNGAPDIIILSDAIDLMTLVTILCRYDEHIPDLLALNEPVPFSTLQGLLENYRYKHFFLPTTPEWVALNRTIPRNTPDYQDHRPLYAGYKALNSWFCHPGNPDYPRLDLEGKNKPYIP
jgi:hypothetical protein